jgi:hypothetical protein
MYYFRLFYLSKVVTVEIGKEIIFKIYVCIYIKTKLRGLSPRANYTDRAAAAVRRS